MPAVPAEHAFQQWEREARILTSIDRLNSWVRSDSARDWYSSPWRAVYDWKHDAIGRAIKAETCEWRGIYLTLNCRDCGGSGKYTDSYGQKFPHCRRCGNTGKTKLTFLVTTIQGFQWHTPSDKTYSFRLPDGWQEKADLSTDWEPKQKGRDLELWEVAEHLNVLEEETAAFGQIAKPGSHGVYDYGNWLGDQQHSKYKLRLGRLPEICELCGHVGQPKGEYGGKDGIHHHVSREHVEWSAWACDSCKVLHGNNCEIFKLFKMPEDRCQHPEIRKWLERRASFTGVSR